MEWDWVARLGVVACVGVPLLVTIYFAHKGGY